MPKSYDSQIVARIASRLKLSPGNTAAAAALLDEGATVPFVARYRKEATGALDEVALLAIRDALSGERELEARRSTILKSLEENDHLTPALEKAVKAASTKSELEDIYLPYKPKRRTRGMAAREKGLEPLADLILLHQDRALNAAPFVNPENGVEDEEAALAGARDIIAERVSEDARLRGTLRRLTMLKGKLKAAVVKKKADEKPDEAAVYRDYFEYAESISRVPSHRILACLRGAKEGFLRVKARAEDEEALPQLERAYIKGRGPAAAQVELAIADAWTRLLAPSLENETLAALKERADKDAIHIFATNLEKMLLAPPLGAKAVLAVDPGYRTGGKLAVLDAHGTLLAHDVIHPEGSNDARQAAARLVETLVKKHGTQAVAVGNGTAGRETEEFLRGVVPQLPVISVDERGASVYSASAEARREFGDLDLTVRGAVSIGRRLQDPLAELVKIEPGAIGVGQYQHDVDSKALAASLDDTVRSAVNAVGVELNTASGALLSHVSGLGPKLAQAIVDKRENDGPYKSRKELLKVPRLGEKAYVQSAGFLRISGARNPLDASAVHPERYALVERMAADLGVKVAELMASQNLRKQIHLENYVEKDGGANSVGLPTLPDIMAELDKPGRDPRGTFELFSFDDRIHSIDDVEKGMVLPGIVTNVTAFGAFVDIGAHRDGLVHISQLSDSFVANPSDIVAVHDKVQVKVTDVDRQRGRIGLSMRGVAED